MAPSATATETEATAAVARLQLNAPKGPTTYRDLSSAVNYDRDRELHGGDGYPGASYPQFLPVWEPSDDPPLQPFDYRDPGLDADPAFPHLLPTGTGLTHLTPTIGSEVTGVQLSRLDAAGRNELARFVAERRVVAFRDQDLADRPVEAVLALGRHFGPLHVHPTAGAPAGYPELAAVHRAAGDTTAAATLETRTGSVTWHSDVSYEAQPPSTTFLYILDGPQASGGDTLFADAVEAYRRLSPALQQRLHGLTATHSGLEQTAAARAKPGGIVRRDGVAYDHPLVRTHPVTGEKALFVNPGFTRRIVGLKQEESDALLKFLFTHLTTGADFHARIKWAPGTVVVWDNRNTMHTALLDWKDGQRRHLLRLTPQGERPYETPFE